MFARFPLLAAGLGFATLGLVSAQSIRIDTAKVDAAANSALTAWKAPGCAIAIIEGDRVLYAKGYGVKELGKPDPVTAKTVFAIGSTTKAFTTAAMAMLVDEGRMHWDDPVRRYLPRFRLSDPLANEMVTLRDLVTHRTGLSRNDLLWYGSPLSRSEILEAIGSVALNKPFRTAWQYQNIMFLAAGEAVAAASGLSWEDFVQSRILDPLKMHHTTLSTGYALGDPDHATGHAKHDGRVEISAWRNIDNIGPAGSINSNIDDLTQWLRLQMNQGVAPGTGKRLVSAANMREMHTPQMAIRPEDWGRNFTDETNQMAYGMGWFLQDYRGEHIVNHGGAIDGFRANFTMVPQRRLGLIVLSNLGEDNMPEALRWSLLDILIGRGKPKDWNAFLIARAQRQPDNLPLRKTATMPSRELAAFAGNYSEPAYGRIEVTLEHEKLFFQWSNFRSPLEHFQYDTFQLSNPKIEGLVTFHLDASGSSHSLDFLGLAFVRSGPAVDAPKVAERIVSQLKLKGNEGVVLRYDPSYLPELNGPLQDAVAKAGGQVVAALPYIAKDSSSGDAELAAMKLRLALAKASVYLWMPLRDSVNQITDSESNLLVNWLRQGGPRREIHFHWNGGSVLADGLPVTHTARFDPIYSDALEIDYERLSTRQDAAIALLQSAPIRVRTPAGTDITFNVGDRPFNKQNGDASPSRMDSARVQVDREIELPAGVLRVAPIEQSVNGTIVIPEARFGDQMTRGLRLTIINGVAVQIDAAQNVDAARKALFSQDIGARSFREFGIGFNPKLIRQAGSPILPYFAYGDGMIRMSLGDNSELGGAVKGQTRRWFFFPDATVDVGDRALVERGQFVREFRN